MTGPAPGDRSPSVAGLAAGRAPGAVHMSKGVIERDVETKVPDKATPLVLYCGGGFRASAE